MYVNAGAISTIKSAIMPTTTSSSMSVKPRTLSGPRSLEIRGRKSDVGETDRSSESARLLLQKNIRVIRDICGVFKRKPPSYTSPGKSPRSSCAPAAALGEDGRSSEQELACCGFTRTRPVMLGANIEGRNIARTRQVTSFYLGESSGQPRMDTNDPKPVPRVRAELGFVFLLLLMLMLLLNFLTIERSAKTRKPNRRKQT